MRKSSDSDWCIFAVDVRYWRYGDSALKRSEDHVWWLFLSSGVVNKDKESCMRRSRRRDEDEPAEPLFDFARFNRHLNSGFEVRRTANTVTGSILSNLDCLEPDTGYTKRLIFHCV